MSTAGVHSDGDRLRAIQVLAHLCSIGATDDTEASIVEHLCTALFALGVTREEIGDAMQFALLTMNPEEDAA